VLAENDRPLQPLSVRRFAPSIKRLEGRSTDGAARSVRAILVWAAQHW
jgi:hypothetical protein